jgi:hypothetical protein
VTSWPSPCPDAPACGCVADMPTRCPVARARHDATSCEWEGKLFLSLVSTYRVMYADAPEAAIRTMKRRIRDLEAAKPDPAAYGRISDAVRVELSALRYLMEEVD